MSFQSWRIHSVSSQLGWLVPRKGRKSSGLYFFLNICSCHAQNDAFSKFLVALFDKKPLFNSGNRTWHGDFAAKNYCVIVSLPNGCDSWTWTLVGSISFANASRCSMVSFSVVAHVFTFVLLVVTWSEMHGRSAWCWFVKSRVHSDVIGGRARGSRDSANSWVTVLVFLRAFRFSGSPSKPF
jgi:hypothetical protein